MPTSVATTVTNPNHSSSRRGFLKGLGYTAASAVALPAMTGVLSTEAQANLQATATPYSYRKNRSLFLRYTAATLNYKMRDPVQTPNKDELLYSGRIANFSKGLPHNDLGEVDPNAYDKFLIAVSTGKPADYEAIPMAGTVKLANPQAALAYQFEGMDSHAFEAPQFSPINSEQMAGEMVELYWHALTRDVPFSQYGQEAQTSAAITELRRFSQYQGVNAATLFRGKTPGEATGPLVSQFLWQDVPSGAMSVAQRCKLPVAGDVHMTNYADWLAIQRGSAAKTSITYDNTLRYIRNAHDLSEWVHQDFSFQAFQHAALILMGIKAQRDTHPYSASLSQSPFITFGGPHILDMVAKACYAALKACWYQKWQVHRSLRPEVLGGRVHNHIRGAARYPLHSGLLNAQAVQNTFSRYGTYLLPQAFPEGSPTHPSYPAGHAAIAGACVTVLKAFFNESYVLPNAVIASDDGLNLLPFNGAALTVGGELNKLAGNIAFGRNYAGVHYRQDGYQGMLLGEKVALQLLIESKMLLNEGNFTFTLSKFNGETISF